METAADFLLAALAAGEVRVYTDGACGPLSKGVGGWSFVAIAGQAEFERSGAVAETTNNRMEITGAVEALKFLPASVVVNVYSDSQYVVNGASKWLMTWQRNGWLLNTDRLPGERDPKTGIRIRFRRGAPIQNVDLWRTVAKIISERRVFWHWIRGHRGAGYNDRADRLAGQARLDFLRAAAPTYQDRALSFSK